MKYYLVTTDIPDGLDSKTKLLILGPWFLAGEKNKRLIIGRDYHLVPSPWKPAVKIKAAADYCYDIYKKLIPQLSNNLNTLHELSYPEKYWQILIGPWLLHLIEVFYDRYKRMEKTLELFPGFHLHALPKEQCKLTPYDASHFLSCITEKDVDYYNLKFFSLIAYDLCPHNIIERGYDHTQDIGTGTIRYNWKTRLFNKLMEPLDLLFKSPIVLADMHRLSLWDIISLKAKAGLGTFRFIDFEPVKKNFSQKTYSREARNSIEMEDPDDKFQALLYRLIPEAIPMCYIENYKPYRNEIANIKDMDYVATVGSGVAWYFNEKFKFFAAEAASKKAMSIEFQHGGGYGQLLSESRESLSLEKDVFYTWGWDPKSDDDKIRTLPDPYLSKLKDVHSPRLNKIIFVSTTMPRYHYRFHTFLLPDDMPKYLEDKIIFLKTLPEEIRENLLYRPYFIDYEWNELEMIKEACPSVKFIVNGRLSDWMRKAKLAVIDHSHTTFIEALTINVPCVFYWDHEVYLMRADAERYFELLREAGMLYKDPIGAAKKVAEIFYDPMEWWLSKKVQDVRLEFCDRFAYARKDWMKEWVREFAKVN